MKLIKEGEAYYEDREAIKQSVVPEDHFAIVDAKSVLLLLGVRKNIVIELAELMLPAGLQSMTVTWAEPPYVDVSGTTVYL